MDPRLRTDTSGPGEPVFAIRFDGQLGSLRKNRGNYYCLLLQSTTSSTILHSIVYSTIQYYLLRWRHTIRNCTFRSESLDISWIFDQNFGQVFDQGFGPGFWVPENTVQSTTRTEKYSFTVRRKTIERPCIKNPILFKIPYIKNLAVQCLMET